jgi:hypothetical protein
VSLFAKNAHFKSNISKNQSTQMNLRQFHMQHWRQNILMSLSSSFDGSDWLRNCWFIHFANTERRDTDQLLALGLVLGNGLNQHFRNEKPDHRIPPAVDRSTVAARAYAPRVVGIKSEVAGIWQSLVSRHRKERPPWYFFRIHLALPVRYTINVPRSQNMPSGDARLE